MANFTVFGRITNQQSNPVGGLTVEAFRLVTRLGFPEQVGRGETSNNGRYEIRFEAPFAADGIRVFIRIFDANRQIAQSRTRRIAASNRIEINESVEVGESREHVVRGQIVAEDWMRPQGWHVTVTDVNIGRASTRLGDSLVGRQLTYEIRYPFIVRGKDKPDIKVQLRDAAGQLLAESDTRYNASEVEAGLDLTIASDRLPRPVEYRRMLEDVGTLFNGNNLIEQLSELKEDDERQDLTYLANKTGWDLRKTRAIVAASQFNLKEDSDIAPDFYYALFEAGVPAIETALSQLSAETAAQIWTQAGLPAEEIEPTRIKFKERAIRNLLTAPATVGVSTLGDIIRHNFDDADARNQFAQLYYEERSDLDAFWTKVDEQFSEETAASLRVGGQLNFLTTNNAPLIERLHRLGEEGHLSAPEELIKHKLYQRESWEPLLADDAIPIPKEFGEGVDGKQAYAAYMAEQLRLSYPTAVISQKIQDDVIPLVEVEQSVKATVTSFLDAHHKTFVLGKQPPEAYLRQLPDDEGVDQATRAELLKLHRVYQISSDDKIVSTLLTEKLDSAYKIVQYDQHTFVNAFGAAFGGEATARTTHAKAQQVHHAVLNIAMNYMLDRSAPSLFAIDNPPVVINIQGEDSAEPSDSDKSDPSDEGNNVSLAYPTLENVFGEMDYCACAHCRSWLSPAAYLVDLLQFLDPPLPDGETSPQQILFDRRPDLQHLQLTCENTNTVLPHIDPANEIMEHYVVAGNLDEFDGFNVNKNTTTEDLLASPQFIEDDAYKKLAEERFPMPLPFHKSLATLRRYFRQFDTPLYEAMEQLRSSDMANRSEGNLAYAWHDILSERLQLSRIEFDLLTDSSEHKLHLLFGEVTEPQDTQAYSRAKRFARRFALSYEELFQLIKTQFVNPHAYLIVKLEKLQLSFLQIRDVLDGTLDDALKEVLPLETLDMTRYGGTNEMSDDAKIDQLKQWLQTHEAQMMGLVTLTSPGETQEDNCSFENEEFRYADPDTASNQLKPIEFLKMVRFIRLWRKLGWSIEQTDKAIAALYPADQYPTTTDDAATAQGKLDAGFQTLLLRLAHLHTIIEKLKLNPKRELVPLLACWADIDTVGGHSLYRQMFLNPTISEMDTVFKPNADNQYLTDANASIVDHTETLRAAFNLTQQAYELIWDEHQFDDNTSLTLANISAIFRFGFLARRLRLSVQEFLLLKALSGLNPFASLDLTLLDTAQSLGSVRPEGIRFVELAQQIRRSPFKISQLGYLLQHVDLTGRASPSMEEIGSIATVMRGTLEQVEAENRIQADSDSEAANAILTKLYGTERAEIFFGLLSGTYPTEIDYLHADPTTNTAVRDAGIHYDAFRKMLAYGGIMSEAARDEIKSLPNVSADFGTGIDALYEENQRVIGRLFPSAQTLLNAYAFFGDLKSATAVQLPDDSNLPIVIRASLGRLVYVQQQNRLIFKGVLHDELVEKLKTAADGSAEIDVAIDSLAADNQQQIQPFFDQHPQLNSLREQLLHASDNVAQRRKIILDAILPESIAQLKRQEVRLLLGSQVNAEAALVEALVDNAAILHAADSAQESASADFMTLEQGGFSAEIYHADDTNGAAAESDVLVSQLNYQADRNPLPQNPAGADRAISGIWRAYLVPPVTGLYNLHVATDAATTITVTIDDIERLFSNDAGQWQNQERIELEAGRLYSLSLKAEKVKDELIFEWSRQDMERTVVASTHLYPTHIFNSFRTTYLRLLKAFAIIEALALSAIEVTHFAQHDDYQIDGKSWLNALPATEQNAAQPQLLKNVVALLDYHVLKQEPRFDDKLPTLLQNPAATNGDNMPLIEQVAGWQKADIGTLLAYWGLAQADLGQLEHFGRLHKALILVEKVGISAKHLIENTTNAPSAEQVHNFQSALRARYSESAWRKLIQPINDELRSLQRDALVAYVLHQLGRDGGTEHINTAEKLFEFFLIDVLMDPCMKTSRIKQAISTVQLFIQRCLLNLEPQVASSLINAEQWKWMNRYRVWEANRKVFLWPENWLEPELRDNKSPFFKDFESELLQSDITDEAAATALLNYLEKLDEVAKLEVCGMYYQEADPVKQQDEVVHVVARTSGARRTYYYRRQDRGLSWSPWEKINLNIEDNPIVPVVWKGRLFLFWLTIQQEPLEAETKGGGGKSLTEVNLSEVKEAAGKPRVRVTAILNWSEYYNDKWQPVHTSDVNNSLDIEDFSVGEFVRSRLHLNSETDGDDLTISLIYYRDGVFSEGYGKAHFRLTNIRSLPIQNANKIFFSSPGPQSGTLSRFFRSDSNQHAFRIDIKKFTTIPDDRWSPLYSNRLINMSGESTFVLPKHKVNDELQAPFSFQDAQHTFFVQSKDKLVAVWEFADIAVHEMPFELDMIRRN